MKKVEEKKTEVQNQQVQAPVVERKAWTRHVHTYYIYDPSKGFLMKDKSFGITGDQYTFDNLQTAKTIQQFFEGTVILTEV